MTLHPYVFFSGNCREAMTRYQEVLGGDLDVVTNADAPPDAQMPGASPDAVMNATLVLDGGILLASDDPTGDGARRRGVAIHHTVADGAEAERVFSALAEGGDVTMPLAETFWAARFGMCTDRFGTAWMISVDLPNDA